MTADYRDDTHIVDGEVQIDKDKLLPEVEKLAKYVRTKMYGVDVRESIALAIQLMSNIVVDDQNAYKQLEAKVDDLSKTWNDKVNDLSAEWNKEVTNFKKLTDDEVDRLVNGWNATISGLTVDSEIIDARIDANGNIFKTLKERIDSFEREELKLNDVGITFNHEFDGYPLVNAWTWEYGLGMVGLGEEPDGLFGGSNVELVNVRVVYLNRESLKIFLPDSLQMLNPTVADQGNGKYLLSQGHRSIGMSIENNGFKG